jgi:hypothetical protein
MAQKVEAANFVFVQLTEQKHPDNVGRTKQIWLGKEILMR